MTKKDMMKKIFSTGTMLFCTLIMTVILLGGCTGGTHTVQVPEREPDYALGVGDNLRISVYGQPDITGEYKVDAKGAVSFPLIGTVPATGFTPTELEQHITEQLDSGYIVDPRVNITVTNYRGVYVLGEVQAPGRYDFAPDMTALQAIALAGGYTYRGNEDRVEITRHVKGALNIFTVDQTTMIKPGDTIVVKRRWF